MGVHTTPFAWEKSLHRFRLISSPVGMQEESGV